MYFVQEQNKSERKVGKYVFFVPIICLGTARGRQCTAALLLAGRPGGQEPGVLRHPGAHHGLHQAQGSRLVYMGFSRLRTLG